MTSERVGSGADAFSTAAQQVVDYLNRNTPLRDWSVSRVTGGEQVHLHVHHGELLETGIRVPWQDTFCRRMTEGHGNVVPDSLANPAFADLELAQTVRSYVGFPIEDDTGDMFGVLCGVDSKPLDGPEAVDADLIELLSNLLSAQLRSSREADHGRREMELSTALADTDALTGLVNRRGWDTLVNEAQGRIDSFGDLVAIAVIDLDGLKSLNDTEGHAAGDELLRRAGSALREAATPLDRVARYGGDEFTILTNNVPVMELDDHYARFAEELSCAGVHASLGHAFTGPGDRSIAEAFRLADAQMYAQKRSRRS